MDYFGDDYLTPEFYLFFWVVLVLIIIILIAYIILCVIREGTLFQPTRDEKWYPDIKRCERIKTLKEVYSDERLQGVENTAKKILGLPKEHLGDNEYCNKYVNNFKSLYLIIDDKSRKGYNKQEICEKKNGKVLNLSSLNYINIWKFENFSGKRIVLYYHGNNDNISYRKYVVDICNLLKLNLMLVDYRGYGESSSFPSNVSLLEDAETAYKHLTSEYSHKDVIIWGESLGGIAAIWTAHKYKANSLVLLSTFADIKTIINKLNMPNGIKKMIKKFSNGELMENGKWIRNVKIPTVIMHSEEDDILPYINAKMNYDAVSAEKKKLITIQGQHAHPFFTDVQLIELLEFIEIDPKVMHNNTLQEVLDIINNI